MDNAAERVISEGFGLVRKNYLEFLKLYLLFAALFGMIILAAVVLFFVYVAGGGLLPGGVSGVAQASGPAVLVVVVIVAAIFLVEPLWIGSYYAMALQYLKGGSMSALGAVKMARRRYVQLLWTMALETLIFVAVDVLIFSPLLAPASGLLDAYSSSGSLGSQATGSAFLVLLGWGVALTVLFLLVALALAPLLYEAVPLVMLEDASGINAVRKSVRMGRSNFWNIAWLIAFFAIIYGLIVAGQDAVIFVLSFLGMLAGSVVGLVVWLLVSAFITAWFYALPVIFYEDYLDRKS